MAILKDQLVKTERGTMPIDLVPSSEPMETFVPDIHFRYLGIHDYLTVDHEAVEHDECITVILEDGETFRCTSDTKIIQSINRLKLINGTLHDTIQCLDINSYNQNERNYVLGLDKNTGKPTRYLIKSIERNGLLFPDVFYKFNFVYQENNFVDKDTFVAIKFKNSEKTIFVR